MSRLKFSSLPVIYTTASAGEGDLAAKPRRKCALVIDDDKDVVTLVAAVLCANGFYVYPAFDGVEGLERFGQVKPDVVILDVLLPKMDGWTTLRKLREVSDVPVIIITALNDLASQNRGRVLGVADYLTKPFIPKFLASRVSELVTRAQ